MPTATPPGSAVSVPSVDRTGSGLRRRPTHAQICSASPSTTRRVAALEFIAESGRVQKLSCQEPTNPLRQALGCRARGHGLELSAIFLAEHRDDTVGLGCLRSEHLPKEPSGNATLLGLLNDEDAQNTVSGKVPSQHPVKRYPAMSSEPSLGEHGRRDRQPLIVASPYSTDGVIDRSLDGRPQPFEIFGVDNRVCGADGVRPSQDCLTDLLMARLHVRKKLTSTPVGFHPTSPRAAAGLDE